MTSESPNCILEPNVHLTIAGAGLEHPSDSKVQVYLRQFITYTQEPSSTRLTLVGRMVLNVKETTDEIDRLIRTAATQV